MKSIRKRLAAVLAALTLLVWCAAPAFALEVVDLSRTGSIKVSLYDSETSEAVGGGTLTLYRVAKVKKDNANLSFVYPNGFEDCGVERGDLSGGELAGRFAEKIAARAIGQIAGKADLIPETDGTAEGLRRRLQEWGVDKGVVLPIATKPTQQTIINDWAAQQQDETLYCYGSVHPDAPDVLEELERIRQLGLHGIKLHPDYQGFFADEPRMLPIYRRCAQLGLPVLFHAGFDPVSPQVRHASPEALARIAEAVPELTLIAAHLGGVLQWDEAERLLVGRKNVYLDTAFASHSIDPGQFERIVQRHGAERILFASDCPWDSPVKIHRIMDDFALTPAQRSRIDWENALELLEQH